MARDIAGYSQKYVADDFERVLVRYRRKQQLKMIESAPHKHILEIGCGLEPIFQYVEDFKQMVIVEPSDTFYCNANELARQKGYLGSCVSIFRGFFEEVADKLQGELFDVILLSSLLHQVQNPEALLESVRTLCGEETLVHVNVPNINSFHRLLAYESGLLTDLNELGERAKGYFTNYIYSLQSLNTLVNQAGFEVQDQGSYFVKPFTHDQMDFLFSSDQIDPAVLDGLDRMVKYMPDLGAEIYVNVKRKP